MEKKKIISVLSICTLLLIGCSSQTAKSEKKTPAKEDIVVSGSGISDLTIRIHSFADLRTQSDAIIYGEVSDFEMAPTEESGFVYTLETIHVIETLQGDLKPGTDIILREDGGYVPVIDFINAFTTEEERSGYREAFFGKLSDEELNTKYYAEVPEGYYYPEIGERAVYCLKHSSVLKDAYYTTGAWQGRFREVEEGVFVKPNNSSSLSDPEDALVNGTITYEELKEELHR